MAYQERVVDAELAERLAAAGAVVIEGAKATGKTATARQIAQSEVLLDIDAQARKLADVDPGLLLASGGTPRLIDEWQVVPSIWDHVRRAVDARALPGQFILTGSATPREDPRQHTGAGRMSVLRMRPMSLFEMGHSSGQVSLARLFDGDQPSTVSPKIQLSELVEMVVVGGWPGRSGMTLRQHLRANRDYLNEIARTEVRNAAGPRRDPDRVLRLLRSLARNVATYTPDTTLAADTGGAAGPLDRETVREYLAALDRLYITENQPSWAPALRSRSILRGEEKRHFCDPSLAVAALRTDPTRLINDLETFGFLFESLVARDLRVYAQKFDGSVLQYHDNTGLEVDEIVASPNGQWAAFEVKLGFGQVEAAAAGLLRFAGRIDTDKIGKPAMLGVIVGLGEYAFVREDGVAVIPIGSLGP